MSLSSKLSITDVDLKGKRVLIRVSIDYYSTHGSWLSVSSGALFLIGLAPIWTFHQSPPVLAAPKD
jgi:hypothetical protein